MDPTNSLYLGRKKEQMSPWTWVTHLISNTLINNVLRVEKQRECVYHSIWNLSKILDLTDDCKEDMIIQKDEIFEPCVVSSCHRNKD